MSAEFITFRDLTGQKCCIQLRYMVAVLLPSPLGGDSKGLVITMNGLQISVTLTVAGELLNRLTTTDATNAGSIM